MKHLDSKKTTGKKNFASKVLMVRPANFGFNGQTAGSNSFQEFTEEGRDSQEKALMEFNAFAQKLENAGIEVLIFEDDNIEIKPDAVFPNNWFSTFEKKIFIYPMLAENRRKERRNDILEKLRSDYGYTSTWDLSSYEDDGIFLEGTGSMIFNHKTKKIYAALSPRTHEILVKQMAAEMGYEPILFSAFDENSRAIYHTNVLLTIANGFAVVCLESVTKEEDKRTVIKNLNADGLEIFEITFDQVKNFCGNMLQLINSDEEPVLIMSLRAKSHFSPLLLSMIERHTKILTADLSVIETIGGGGARCMLAEIF